MECKHKPTNHIFAVKRFEQIYGNDQRGIRLLRELTILSNVNHACLNKLVTVFPPMIAKDSSEVLDAYLVIDKCDMDLKKLLRSNKFLDEI